MNKTIFSMEIHSEQDVVVVRQRVRHVAGLLGFNPMGQTRLATAASEVARNATLYAGGGQVEFLIEGKPTSQMFLIRISDLGPGPDRPSAIRGERTASEEERNLGLISARKLVEFFRLEASPDGKKTIVLGAALPPDAPGVGRNELMKMAIDLVQSTPQDSLEIIKQQNQELLRLLDTLNQRQEDLTRINRELEDTNRGVLALYAELEEKAEHLRQADQLKSRFLSHMSHEFRTPINSITALTQILLDRTDGELTAEQELQLSFIRKSAQDLSTLVNDLLDLAKIEAGRSEVRTARIEVADLFSALRGMMRPLLRDDSVDLIFEEPRGLPALYTDEGKISQILRNLISNALKFTEAGRILVSASLDAEGKRIIFSVSDTGVGIAPEHQEWIFQEFTQLESPVQKKTRGTGLGLPLSRKLAALLGGSLTVESEVGVGSTFTATIPVVYAEPEPEPAEVKDRLRVDQSRLPVLVIEDDYKTLYTYENYLRGSGFQIIPARNVREAREIMKQVRPMAIVLDILLPGQSGWDFLAEMKENEETADIPILVVTVLKDQKRDLLLGADDYCVKPVKCSWLLQRLKKLVKEGVAGKVLVIDDEEISRYLMRGLLADTRYTVIEAASGPEGLQKAASEKPEVIFLDLMMPGMSGFEVLDRLKADPVTRDIPVIIVTAKVLEEEEQSHLAEYALAVLSKEGESRRATVDQIREVLSKIRMNREGSPVEKEKDRS